MAERAGEVATRIEERLKETPNGLLTLDLLDIAREAGMPLEEAIGVVQRLRSSRRVEIVDDRWVIVRA